MVQKLNLLKESASQTAGPYVHIGCVPNFCGIEGVYPKDLGSSMVNDKTEGERITIRGRVFDGTGTPLKDVMLEIWQADHNGLYPAANEMRGEADSNFTGWGRSAGDYITGEYVFETVKPGVVPFIDGKPMAPHITFWVVARGINVGLHTRMYFPEEEAANSADPVLGRIEHQVRVPTLIGKKTGEGEYTFDIVLQGENETVFFDI